MPRTDASELESNEFELVLGNKQLLSVFFIVVMLLAVFFTMGYMLGRNSAPVDTSRRAAEQQPIERQNAPSAVPAAPVKREAPAVEIEKPRETKPAPTAKTEQAPPKPIEIPPVTVTQPSVGQVYLQVLAVAKPEADVLAEVLVKKGFHALVAPGPNDKVYRVLVGPAKDAGDAAKLKGDLVAAGFKPFIKKY
jgi:cell division protein FtsN